MSGFFCSAWEKSHILLSIFKEDDFTYYIIQNTILSWNLPFYLENTSNKALGLVSSLIIFWQSAAALWVVGWRGKSRGPGQFSTEKDSPPENVRALPIYDGPMPPWLRLWTFNAPQFAAVCKQPGLFFPTWLPWVCLGRSLVKTAKPEKSGLGAFPMTDWFLSFPCHLHHSRAPAISRRHSHVGLSSTCFPANRTLVFRVSFHPALLLAGSHFN